MVTKLVNEVTDGRSDLCRTGKKKKKRQKGRPDRHMCSSRGGCVCAVEKLGRKK